MANPTRGGRPVWWAVVLGVLAACGGPAAPSDAGSGTVDVDAGVVDAGALDAGAVDAGAIDAGASCVGGCDDANPCTMDACFGTACTHAALTGTTCDDSNPATASDACDATGACIGQPVSCPADTTCLHYTPNGTTTCSAAPQVGDACDDANVATSDDRCSMSGVCAGAPITCPADTVCLTYAPNGTSTCVSTARVGVSCDDQSVTTADDRCTAAGTCAGTPVTCPANTACTTFAPNGTATCTTTFLDGAACEDQNACTPTGTCAAGACVVGAAITCSNGGTCANGGCTCPAAWTGPTCATDVNECAQAACGGGSNCTNTQGGFTCQCQTNFTSSTGANCTSTVAALEVIVFYDESVARKFGPDPEARIAALFNRSKSVFDTSLLPPPLTLSLNAVIRLAPLPSTLVKRACDTVDPGTSCVGCYQGGSSGFCGTLLSNSASEIDTAQLLNSFNTFISARRAAIAAQTAGFDVAVLLTDADFASSVTGLAFVSGSCRTSNTAVVSTAGTSGDDAIAAIITHELGHTLGMSHDSTSGFVMSPAVSVPPSTTFSAASLTAYQTWRTQLGALDCISDVARSDWATRPCGNGVIDPGETCDPAVLSDTCCASCQLQPGCACANTEPCCRSGAPADAGVVCRSSRGECDLADTCDGQTGACLDTYKSPRATCANTGFCLRGDCASRGVQCSTLGQQSGLTLTSCESSVRCDRLDCSNGGSCNTFFSTVSPSNGSQCGASNQCVAGLCVPSAALKDYAWVTGPWTVCTSGATSTRSVSCVDESGVVAASTLCDPDGKPAASRVCP